jgi:hypothetical protein
MSYKIKQYFGINTFCCRCLTLKKSTANINTFFACCCTFLLSYTSFGFLVISFIQSFLNTFLVRRFVFGFLVVSRYVSFPSAVYSFLLSYPPSMRREAIVIRGDQRSFTVPRFGSKTAC